MDDIYLRLTFPQQIVKHRFAGNEKTLALFQREIDICRQLEHVSYLSHFVQPS